MILLLAGNAAPINAEDIHAGQAATLDLRQAVRQSMAYSPRLKTEDFVVAAARSARREALAGYLPKLTANLETTNGNDPVYVFSSLLKQQSLASEDMAVSALNKPDDVFNHQTSLDMTIPIFTGFQNEGRVRSSGWALKASESSRGDFEQKVMLSAIQSYLQVLSLDKTLQALERTIAEGEMAVNEAESLKEKGMVLGCDYLTGKAVLTRMKQMRRMAESRRQSSLGSLKILLGITSGDPVLQAIQPLDTMPEISIEELKAEAAARRKDSETARHNLALAESEVKRASSSRLPTVSAFVHGENNISQWGENGGDNYLAGLKASMDLFEPSLGPKIRQLRAHAEQEKEMARHLDDAIQDELQQSAAEYTAQNENLKLARQAFFDSQQAALEVKDLYRTGKRTIADLLESQAYRLELETAYWQARYQATFLYARLIYAAGRLDLNFVEEFTTLVSTDR
ncbi:MAG: TolC family protein [Candidatus Omnitrophota bacterium]|nr:TolC family protein [Candidatus Omnitrophota bacterium]MDZ4241579.1 TolC family protein [Candidatus Omnitrophota bacterium]